MGNDGFSAVQRLPAPYLPIADDLIDLARSADHVAFYRSSASNLREPVIDRFAAGTFNCREFVWSACNGSSVVGHMQKCFDSLSTDMGALVGYITYEAGLIFEPRWCNMLSSPLAGFAWRFLEVPCWYEADHAAKEGQIIVCKSASPELVEYITSLVKEAANRNQLAHPQLSPANLMEWDKLAALGELTKDSYMSSVESILEDIAAGRYYELNFTQRFRLSSNKHPSAVFTDLFRQLSPRRGFYSNMAGEAVCGFSPEVYLSKTGPAITTVPIKGSVVGQPSELEWEKLHAEHVMVVDLARNDLGRVSDLSPVRVSQFMASQNFGGLTHFESVIEGESSMDWKEILKLTYPAASITGAPKVEVVSAIAEYEASPRGVYTGACGWIEPNGNLDLNVAIRTATAAQSAEEWFYELGGGGAIVADSDPSAEYYECLRKIRPIASVLADVNNLSWKW